MASANAVFIMGNLTREPALRYLPSGQPVVTFSVAVNRVFVSQSGEKKEEASFVPVVVWGKLAETCNQYLTKGSPVFVEGRLRSRSWEAQDGTKRSAIEVIARNVQFLGKFKERGQARLPDGQAEGMPRSSGEEMSALNHDGSGSAEDVPQEPIKEDDVPF